MTAQPQQPVTLMPSLLVLALCLGSLLVAALLTPPHPGAKNLTLAGFVLPPACTLNSQFGLPCPGCGLTRSWVSAAHGDLTTSLGFHRLGWLVMLYVVLQAVRHACWLFVPRARERVARWSPYLDKSIVLLGALVMLNWVLLLAGF